MLCLLVVLQLLLTTSAFPMFQMEIPNGPKVPHPCGGGRGNWPGVGHWNMGGGGERNPFGLAFYGNGKKWNEALCKLDSDGDGKTNGEELGDPGCTWVKGGPPPTGQATGHPGICEPVNSALCRKRNVDIRGTMRVACLPPKQKKTCKGENTGKSDITRMNLRFDTTNIPATETNYYCKMFNLNVPDKTRDYHITADKPFVGNKNIVHHMLLYACPDNVDVSDMEKRFGSKPAPCGMMVQEKCSQIIGGWAAGASGSCFDDLEAATRIGKTGFKKAVLEVHWNNPYKLTGNIDNSGIDLFYSTKLRPFDLGVLTVGQNGITIPPGIPDWPSESQCTSKCIGDKLRANGKNNIRIVSVGLHMHLAGKAAYLDLYRKGGDVVPLAYDDKFDYNAPKDFNHYPAINLGPTDELRLTCLFDSTKRTKHTYYGPATSDEMCYSYVTYYPQIKDFTLCLQYGKTHHCNGSGTLTNVGNCDVTKKGSAKKLELLEKMCDLSGKCKCTCLDLFDQKDPCFEYGSDGRQYLEYALHSDPKGPGYLRRIRSCDEKRDPKKPCDL